MRYRDKLTGRFVAKATWQRSRAQGGNRYKREAGSRRTPEAKRSRALPEPRVPRKRGLPKPRRLSDEERIEEIEAEIDEDFEYTGAFDSP
jgi:hypothetical protein